MTLVRCVDVSRTFGHGEQAVVAVHGCSCEIEPGARIAITGSSGSGKSTLLHLLAGLETPTGGEIGWPELAESPVERSRDISVVFQGQSLLPALTVAENVALAAVLTGTEEAEADVRAAAAMETVGITSLAHQLADTLSGGQAQRTAIARALALRPRLLLADEPTGQLDTDNGNHVLDALLAAADETGAALVVTTHDPAVANRLTDRWQMKDGRLVVPAREGVS